MKNEEEKLRNNCGCNGWMRKSTTRCIYSEKRLIQKQKQNNSEETDNNKIICGWYIVVSRFVYNTKKINDVGLIKMKLKTDRSKFYQDNTLADIIKWIIIKNEINII